MAEQHFIIIDFDGWNVGLKDSFTLTYLEFDSYAEAASVAILWDHWINNG